jgi:hypothetical protein
MISRPYIYLIVKIQKQKQIQKSLKIEGKSELRRLMIWRIINANLGMSFRVSFYFQRTFWTLQLQANPSRKIPVIVTLE